MLSDSGSEESDSDYGWEEVEAFEEFQKRKATLKREGATLSEKDLFNLHPYQTQQCLLDSLRLLGALIFLVDLCLKVAYFRVSKFIDIEIRTMYLIFIIARPTIVLGYHIYSQLVVTHKVVYLYLKDRKTHKELADINQQIENMSNEEANGMINPLED